jgi:hypothetical protein
MAGLAVRPWTIGLVISLVITTAFAGHAVWPRHVDRRPVVLPESLQGIPRAPSNFDIGADQTWQRQLQKKLGGAGLSARSFKPTVQGQRPMLVNLTVTRTDLTNKFDEHLARKPDIRIGAVTCSQMLDFAAGLPKAIQQKSDIKDTGPTYQADKVICWRNSADLSVVVFALYTPDDYRDTVAQMVDEAWTEVRSTS